MSTKTQKTPPNTKQAKQGNVASDVSEAQEVLTTPTTEPVLKDGQRRIRVQFDITYGGAEGETIKGESRTEPDMTMTVRQMLERASKGQSVPQSQPVYFDMQVPTLSDFTDIEIYKRQLQQRLADVSTFIDNEVAQSKAEYEQKKAQQEKDKTPPAPPPTA